MNAEQILALFDQEQRREVHFSDVRREVTPTVVRQVGLYHPESAIIYSWLNPANVEAAIREEIAYFSGLDHDLEWKVYEHDSPADLKERLLAHGFEAEETEALVILDIETSPPPYCSRPCPMTCGASPTPTTWARWRQCKKRSGRRILAG